MTKTSLFHIIIIFDIMLYQEEYVESNKYIKRITHYYVVECVILVNICIYITDKNIFFINFEAKKIVTIIN